MMLRPEIAPSLEPPTTADPARYIRFAFEGGDITPLVAEELGKLSDGRIDPAALMNLSVLYQLVARRADALACQNAALHYERLYRNARPDPAPDAAMPLRLLAIMTAGDLMTNTPLELMLDGCAVETTKLFLMADDRGAVSVPDHDVAIVAASESDETRTLLASLEGLASVWPRPLVNDAARIADLGRDRLHEVLTDVEGVFIPATIRAPRDILQSIVAGDAKWSALLPSTAFPIIARPVGSHAGKGLDKIDDLAELAAYLEAQPAATIYISPFVDYSSPDGRFRKYRIAFFGGRAYLSHMAIGDHWMVHYLNAGMAEDEAKRAEEQAVMEGFDTDFARRHAAGFAALQAKIGLDYFAIDCAELADGALLVFEADVAMVIHDLDPDDLYPYKKPQMRKLFDAFERFLRSKAGSVNPS